MAAPSKSYWYFLDRYHTVAFMYRIVKYEARNVPFTHINVIYWYPDTSVQVLVDLDSPAVLAKLGPPYLLPSVRYQIRPKINHKNPRYVNCLIQHLKYF